MKYAVNDIVRMTLFFGYLSLVKRKVERSVLMTCSLSSWEVFRLREDLFYGFLPSQEWRGIYGFRIKHGM